jgi:parallel beta-helix repeat protein
MKTLLTKSLVAILLTLAASHAWAVTRYLPAGTADQTAAFQALISQSVAGDIIIVRSGNHFLSGTVIINKNNITVRGENGNVIRKSGNLSCIDLTASYVVFDNIYIDGGNRPEPCMRVYGNYNNILNSTFRNSGNSGLLIHGCHHNNIQGCKAFYNYMVGISQWAHSDGTVRDSQMYENGAEGLTIDGATHNNRVFNNWIHLNNRPHRGVGGIGIDDSDGAWIYNNTIDQNGFSGITFQNNLCCGSDGSRIYNNPNISYNERCAVMIRTTQPVTNLQFTGNTCVGNPGGVMCYTAGGGGQEEIAQEETITEEEAAKIFPNPVRDIITINDATNIKSVALVSLSGQELFQKFNDEEPTIKIDVTTVTKGVYILKMRRRDGVLKITKVIKE